MFQYYHEIFDQQFVACRLIEALKLMKTIRKKEKYVFEKEVVTLFVINKWTQKSSDNLLYFTTIFIEEL